MPHNDQACQAFAARLSEYLGREVLYRGETMEVLSCRALEALMKPPQRKRLTIDQEKQILTRQNDKCALCGDVLTAQGYQLDHVIARRSGGSDDLENMQALCGLCHVGKSYTENVNSVEDDNVLMSRLNRETFEAFHNSAKPPQLVADLHEPNEAWGPVLNVDVCRCRYNGFMQHVHDLPVFSAVDSIEPAVAGELGDYNWVDRGNVKHPLAALPYHGAGWYTRMSCEFMLSYGLIDWSHIELTFNASAHIPARYLKERLAKLEELWVTVGGKDTSKRALNSMLGLWGKPKRFRYRLFTTSDVEDLRFQGHRSKKPTPGGEGVYHDIVTQTELLSYGTMRPVHQVCLESERLQIARALYVMRQFCKPERILSLHTDGIFAQPGPAPTRKIQDQLKTLKYCDLAHLRDTFEGAPSAKQARITLKGRCVKPVREAPTTSQDTVYKVEVVDCAVMPGGTLHVEERLAPRLANLDWKTTREPTGGPDEFFEATVKPHVLAGGSKALLASEKALS
jgi:5-methylcytosine-specific restriction endonuclease McrA